MIDTKELRRLAQAATPGPWRIVEDHHFPGVHAGGEVVLGGSFCDFSEPHKHDQEFIAAANPTIIIELLDRLEAAEKERNKLCDDLEVERMRLAACGVAALGYFSGCAKEYRSASLDDVLALCAKNEELRTKIETMEKGVPEKVEVREDEGHIFSRGSYNEGYDNGWNDCREAMLAATKGQ